MDDEALERGSVEPVLDASGPSEGGALEQIPELEERVSGIEQTVGEMRADVDSVTTAVEEMRGGVAPAAAPVVNKETAEKPKFQISTFM